MSRDALVRTEPCVRLDGLQGGFRYFDCVVNDARLTLANVRSAARDHAAIASYVEATDVITEGGRVTGVNFTDRLSGATGALHAHLVVAAAGPWTDRVRALAGGQPMLRPTKGIHVVVEQARLPLANAIPFQFGDRMMFAVPHGEYTYIGTTDTDYPGDPGQVRAETDDVAYTIEAANSAFSVDLSPRRHTLHLGRRAAPRLRGGHTLRRGPGLRDPGGPRGLHHHSRRQAHHLSGHG